MPTISDKGAVIKFSHRTSERNPGDTNTLEGRTYTLNCNREVGDMLYLTDLDYTSPTGHCIAEVEIYGQGKEDIIKFNYSMYGTCTRKFLRGEKGPETISHQNLNDRPMYMSTNKR